MRYSLFMSTLVAELRPDVTGKMVTRHVKVGVTPVARNFSAPAPTFTPDSGSDVAEIDDANIMSQLGIYDTSSADCERVEEYLEDEYGATFNYDDGVEMITFNDSHEAQRFSDALCSGSLKPELKDMLEEYR